MIVYNFRCMKIVKCQHVGDLCMISNSPTICDKPRANEKLFVLKITRKFPNNYIHLRCEQVFVFCLYVLIRRLFPHMDKQNKIQNLEINR